MKLFQSQRFYILFTYITITAYSSLFLFHEANANLLEISKEKEKLIVKIIENMTIKEKIGQMFMLGFNNFIVEKDEYITKFIQQYKIGNVILFERNIAGMRPYFDPPFPSINDLTIPKNVARLVNSLQDLVQPLINYDITIPLFIAVDQENGTRLIVEKGVTLFPGNLSLGQTHDSYLTYCSGKITGIELKAMGITMNLAPVIDVNTNSRNDIIGSRAFGGHPDIVTPLGVSFMNGLHDSGIISVAKHFPGHGDSKTNPHYKLPVVRYDLDYLHRINFKPFKAIIEAGVNAIMPAHIEFTAMTSKGFPVSLDKKIIKQVLRNEMKFNGIVISDDLNMGAIKKRFSLEQAINLAIEAGNDIIMLAHFDKSNYNYKKFVEVFNNLIKKYKTNSQTIDNSVKKILTLKMMINDLDISLWKANISEIPKKIRTKEHIEIAQKVADSSIVLFSEFGKLSSSIENTKLFSGKNFPMIDIDPSEKIIVVSPVWAPPDLLVEKIKEKNRHHVDSVKLIYNWYSESAKKIASNLWKQDANIDIETISSLIIEKSKSAKTIIFGVVTELHYKILSKIASIIEEKPIIVIAFRTPYLMPTDLLSKKNIIFLVNGTGTSVDTSVEATVKVLYGEIKPKTSNYITVSIEDWINRSASIGAQIIPYSKSNSNVSKKKDKSSKSSQELINKKNIEYGNLLKPKLDTNHNDQKISHINTIKSWVYKNKEWFFSGIGLVFVNLFILIFSYIKRNYNLLFKTVIITFPCIICVILLYLYTPKQFANISTGVSLVFAAISLYISYIDWYNKINNSNNNLPKNQS